MSLAFRDPIHDGATDPTVVRHRTTGEWWMYYTQRRAGLECAGVEWVHGTDIGIAVSADEGRTWTYRGIAEGLAHEEGRMTYWAPEVLAAVDGYHMYVSCLSGVRDAWVGPAHVLHYVSADLLTWEFRSVLDLGSDRVIDATVYPLPDGTGWRMWFKDERDDSRIHAADSPDLHTWTRRPVPAAADQPQEGPTVFRLAGAYWMVTDNWKGLSAYRSPDLDTWTRRPYQLLDTAPEGHHAMALEQGESAAVLWYFTPDADDPAGRRSAVGTARLGVRDGRLVCDPDARVAPLTAALTRGLRGGTGD